MSATLAQKNYEKAAQLLKAGKLSEAETFIAQAIALDEQQSQYWLKLGLIWTKQTRHAEAQDAYHMAVTLQPDNADALFNLGMSYIELENADAGLSWIEKSFQIKPDKTLAENLGDYFFNKENYKYATHYYMKARQSDPAAPETQFKLASALYRDNDTVRAIILNVDLVSRFPTNKAYMSSLVDMYRKFNHTSFDEPAYKVLLICLKTDNIKHRNLGPAWASLTKLNPALAPLFSLQNAPPASVDLNSLRTQLEDEFLNIGLLSLPILDLGLEKILTGVRRYLLLSLDQPESAPKELLIFLSSLATQCWYNDFVFYETPEEQTALAELEVKVRDILASSEEMGLGEAILVSLYSCYRPLHVIKQKGVRLPFAKGLIYDMRALIKAQVTNPEREMDLIPTIPHFTEITDDVSLAVQAMYAQRPYPRWKSASKGTLPASIADLSRGLEILVAGCGTGQETAMFANSMPYARTTAIDLSLPSIAYGKRMAEELEFLPKIHFMHGDLIDVGKIGKTFDLVVSSGVLHHMKDPEKGFRAILGTLKQGGRMSISLYSKIARDAMLSPAQEYIREKGYSSSIDDMRKFRKDIMELPEDNPARLCTCATDFFMLSECNDLLFHIQEHRMTFPVLKELTARIGLELFHIYMPPGPLKAWIDKFGPVPVTDFDKLHEFEQAYPDTFREMYKMYFKRRGDASEHQVDALIKANII